MTALRYTFLACVIFNVLNGYVDGLQCYVCDGCSGPFDQNHARLESRPDNEGYSCVKAWSPMNVKRSIMKACIPANASGFGTLCCRADFCNGATNLVSMQWLWSLLSIGISLMLLF